MSEQTSGILKLLPRGGGVLRDPARSLQPFPDDAKVSQKLIQQYGLAEGAAVAGPLRGAGNNRELVGVESVCGLPPEQFQARTRFDRLVAIDPRERIRLGDGGNVAMRIVELIAPIGQGTRGLIVAPPKTGKTILLEQIANAVAAASPNTRTILLLIDERPEEVTHFRRNVQAEVWASSNDQSTEAHIALAELAMAHIRCELECGRNLVILIDSITRLARARNLNTASGGSRTLSGGMDARALELPRRLFGLARNVEKGGSVTVIATALVQTGSRMDDLIFEEFKSTGNSELVLDRALAEARVFPAINLLRSGTRKEELLYTPEQVEKLALLRRALAARDPKSALQGMLRLIDKAPNNDELLARLKAKTS
jgi:transcription termination factor Rho